MEDIIAAVNLPAQSDSDSKVVNRQKSVADDDLALARLLQQQEMVFYNMSGSHEEGDELDADDDEAFARRLQEQENMYAGASYDELEEHMEAGPDLEALPYEDLQALGDVVGTVSKGVKPEVLQQLPSMACRDLPAAGHAASCDRCCVCQCEYEGSERVLVLPCSHLYHKECITEWLARNKTCPTCNKEVTGPTTLK